MSLVARITALTEPSPTLTDPMDRIRARALTQMILLIVPVGVIASTVPLLDNPTFFPIFANNAIGFVVLTVAGFFARTRHFRLAAGLSIMTAAYMVLAAGLLIEDDPVWWAHGMVVVLVATLLLSLRGALVSAALMVAGVMAVLVLQGKSGSALYSPIGFYFVFAPLLILVAYHRDFVERLRNRERLEMAQTLAEKERLETVGRIAGGIAHDFNNVLTVVMASAGLVRDVAEPTPELETLIDEIDAATERASRLTQQLLAYSRQQVLDRQSLDIHELVTQMHPLLQAVIRGKVTIDGTRGAWVMADASQLEQVVLNLAVNASDGYEAIGADATHRLHIEVSHDDSTVVLRVSDEAGGMTPDVVSRAFEPFFTTRSGSQAAGLGLSTVQGIVHQCGGDITIQTESGKGTTFEIRFPLAPAVDDEEE